MLSHKTIDISVLQGVSVEQLLQILLAGVQVSGHHAMRPRVLARDAFSGCSAALLTLLTPPKPAVRDAVNVASKSTPISYGKSPRSELCLS